MATRIQIRRDTSANWTASNPVLAVGEQALETDTGYVKMGDGSTVWSSLKYTSGGIAAPWTAYTPSVTGFTSVVTTATGYYVQIGKTCHVRVSVTIGAVTTLGTTIITVSLPLIASATQGTNRFICGVYRANVGYYMPCAVAIGNSAPVFAVYTQVPGAASPNMSGWYGNAPAGQVAGDIWSWNFTYEIA